MTFNFVTFKLIFCEFSVIELIIIGTGRINLVVAKKLGSLTIAKSHNLDRRIVFMVNYLQLI
jgi:hypothetical protein